MFADTTRGPVGAGAARDHRPHPSPRPLPSELRRGAALARRRNREHLLARCFPLGPKNVGIGCNPNFSGPEVFQGALTNVVLVREALTEEAIQKFSTAGPGKQQ